MLAAGLLAVVGVAGLAAVPHFMDMPTRHPVERALVTAYQSWVLSAAFIAAAGGALALLHARQSRRDLSVLTMAVAGFAATHLLLAGFEPYGQLRAGKDVAQKMQPELKPDTPIYSVQTYEQSITFYLRRTVILVDYLDEFAFGQGQQPELAIATLDGFVTRWDAHTAAGVKAVAIVSDDAYAALKARGVTMRVVTADIRRVVVANR
jgi:hypothetical protein